MDIRQTQEQLGHSHVETTMIYTHVVGDLRNPARSPLDTLEEGGARARPAVESPRPRQPGREREPDES